MVRPHSDSTTLAVDVREAQSSDREIIAGLLESYLHELAQYADFTADAAVARRYPYLDPYFAEAGRRPFLIWHNNTIAGFVLVRDPVSTGSDWQVAEFYITPENRRMGIGRRAIASIWRRFPGSWELQVHARNAAARRFWTACIERLAHGAPEVRDIDAGDGRRFQFNFRIARAG